MMRTWSPRTFLVLAALFCLLGSSTARAQGAPPAPANESELGEFVVTGHKEEKLPRIAILPSLSPDLEDVVVRSVVRRDIELTGLFELISDSKAPTGLYSFDDPVDVEAWQKLGAEAIVKVAARPRGNKAEVFGLAYFLNVGKDPVYQKKITVDKADVRVTAHRITDALLGALTGRPGGFASQFTFSARWTKHNRVFRMDADGQSLTPLSDAAENAISPTWGPNGALFFSTSRDYAPFSIASLAGGPQKPFALPFKTSVYSISYNKDFTKIAVAVAEGGKSTIYVAMADGSGMNKASTTDLAVHPVWSPSGKLAWVGGDANHGSQRIYVDGKPASPAGFPATSPTFCDTEDGVRLVYSVAVGGGRYDLVWGDELGRGTSRLTQGQGSNTYPACSPDGRLLAFFSTRKDQPGMYMMSLKRFTTLQVTSKPGESLRWAALPAIK
ncbi:MAG TPA: tolB protein [Polyangiaceae bacterium]